MFGCGDYIVEWIDSKGNAIKSERKYLTYQGYNQEVMNMQTAFLKGQDVAGLNIKPCQD